MIRTMTLMSAVTISAVASAALAQSATGLPTDTARVFTLETQYGALPRHHMRAFTDIVYDPEAEATDTWFERALDVYVACAVTEPDVCRSNETFQIAQDRPVLIYVHGGASVGGDKQWVKDLGMKPVWAAVDLGMVFVSINYRLREPGEYPNAQQDAANAIAWVHENIARYGGDPERIIVAGHSAGASLITRIATDATFLEAAGRDLGVIKAAVTIDGGNMREADGDAPAPVDQVASEENTGIPPFLSLHVGQGGNSQQDAEALVAAIGARGGSATEVELVGYNHFTANEGVGLRGDSATVAVERFLAEQGFLDEASGGVGVIAAGR